MGRKRALRTLAQAQWAITERGLQQVRAAALGPRPRSGAAAPAASGHILSGTRRMTIRDGVATQRILGPLMRYHDWYFDALGWSSYESLAADFAVALASPEVKAIVQWFDTPGGEASGCHDLSRQIFAARGVKPVVAFIAGEGCSAGYYLAAAAAEVVAEPNAIVGCLGTRFSYLDDSEFLAQLGLRAIDIISSQTPEKMADPASPAAQAALQEVADRLADVFLNDVAAYRGIDRAVVVSDYGRGGVFVGEAAVTAGMVDRIATYDTLHAELAAAPGGPTRLSAGRAARALTASISQEPAMPDLAPTPPMTPEAFAAQHPEAVAAWRAEGARAERERIAAIDQLARPGLEALITAAKADPTCTAGDAAVRILEAEAAQAKARLGALAANETRSDMPPAAPTPDDDPGADSAVAARVLATHRRLTGATPDRAPAQRS